MSGEVWHTICLYKERAAKHRKEQKPDAAHYIIVLTTKVKTKTNKRLWEKLLVSTWEQQTLVSQYLKETNQL
jgi:hypothetical protein